MRFLIPCALLSGVLSTSALASERVPKDQGSNILSPKVLTELLQKARTDKQQKNVVYLGDIKTPENKAVQEVDLSGSTVSSVCFSSVGPWQPWGSSFRDDINRAWTCESRDSVVKALGFTSVFLKGTSYVCSFTPLPQAQVAAKVFDIASYASSSIGLVVSVTNCENKLEDKFNALIKACEELRTMNIDCQGVDNTPF